MRPSLSSQMQVGRLGGQAGRAAAAGAQPAVHAAAQAWQLCCLGLSSRRQARFLPARPCVKRHTSPAPSRADLEKAARAVVASSHRNAGQTCICTNRVLVHVRAAIVWIA